MTRIRPGGTSAAGLPAQTRWVIQGRSLPALRIYPTIAEAVAAAGPQDVIELDAGDHSITSTVTITGKDYLVIRGRGVRASRIVVDGDIVGLDFDAIHYPTIRDLTIYTPTTSRTVFPLRFTDAVHPECVGVRFEGADGARRSGVHITGVGGVASMGLIRSCVFSHSCILAEVDDIKIVSSWIWAMTCDYAIAVRDGSANVAVTDVDIVPPLLSTATGIAGIVVGDDGVAAMNFKASGVYLDGNPSLVVRAGIHIFNGTAGAILHNVHGNKLDAEAIILDSCYNVVVDGYTSYSNNAAGAGAAEILIRQTGAQPTENIRVSNAQFLQTTAVTGTAGPAIKVESTVGADQVTIDSCDVKQPAGGGGYTVPEIDVPVSGGYPTQSVACRGKLGKYRAVGSVAVASGDAGKSITLSSPFPMAYRPRPSQIHLSMESAGQTLPPYRITYSSDNQIYVAFASALTNSGTLHYRVDLRR